MKQVLGNHPITSICGYLAGAATAALTLIPAWTDPITHSVNWLQVIIGIIIAVLGRNASDANNTVTKS